MASRRRYVSLGIVLLGTILNPLDGSMIVVALPALSEIFREFSGLSVLVLATYYLGSALAQPLMGRIADIIGPRRSFLGGMLITCAACVAILFCHNAVLLIVLRFIQSLGSSSAYPSGIALLHQRVRSAEKIKRDVATITWVNSSAAILGPFVGGILVTWIGWQGPFLLSAILSGFASCFALAIFDSQPKSVGMAAITSSLRGAFWFVLALSALQSGIILLPSCWPLAIGSLLVAVGSAWLFWRVSQHRKAGFLDLDLIRDPRKLMIYAQYFLANFLFFGTLILLPLWLQIAEGNDAFLAGIMSLPVALFGVLSNLVFAHRITSANAQIVLSVLVMLQLVGCVLLAAAIGYRSGGGFAVITACVLLGAPNNLCTFILQTSLLNRVVWQETGAVTGLFQASRYTAAALSSSLLSVFASVTISQQFKDDAQVIGVMFLFVSVVSATLCATVRPARTDDIH